VFSTYSRSFPGRAAYFGPPLVWMSSVGSVATMISGGSGFSSLPDGGAFLSACCPPPSPRSWPPPSPAVSGPRLEGLHPLSTSRRVPVRCTRTPRVQYHAPAASCTRRTRILARFRLVPSTGRTRGFPSYRSSHGGPGAEHDLRRIRPQPLDGGLLFLRQLERRKDRVEGAVDVPLRDLPLEQPGRFFSACSGSGSENLTLGTLIFSRV